MSRTLACLCAMLAAPIGLALAAPPAPRVATGSPVSPIAQKPPSLPSHPLLPVKLGDLLRQLDYDQSRKLTRQIEPAQSVFTSSDLATAVATLATPPAFALLVVGRRGPLSDSPLEIHEAFRIPDGQLQQTLGELPPKLRQRSAYVPRGAPDGDWSSALASIGDGERVKPVLLSRALSAPGSAAFLFAMRQRSVEKVILIPDTVRITVNGNGPSQPPPSRPMPMRPEIPRPYVMPPQEYPMPDAPEPPPPEPVEPPSEDSGE